MSLDDAINDLETHDSSPTLPLSDVQKQRATQLARELDQAMTQAHVEANVAAKALELAQLLGGAALSMIGR